MVELGKARGVVFRRLSQRSSLRRRSGLVVLTATVGFSLLGTATAASGETVMTATAARIVTPGRNLPDPFILHVGSEYYMYSSQTSIYTPTVSLTMSKGDSLFSWGKTRAALDSVSSLAENGFSWAPDVRRIDGLYVLYFDAWSRKSMYFAPSESGFKQRGQCLWTATSESPAGPFSPQHRPLLCQFNHHGDIDPRTFVSPSTQLWLIWKSDDNAFEPARPTYLWSQHLSSNGLSLVGERYVIFAGKRGTWSGGLVEAPDMVYASHTYWLFFSGNWFNGPNYSIGLARCASPAGPCASVSIHPWLSSNPLGRNPGEESLVRNAQGWWIAFSPSEGKYRPVAIASVSFDSHDAFVHGL